jgi:hypothetical protein
VRSVKRTPATFDLSNLPLSHTLNRRKDAPPAKHLIEFRRDRREAVFLFAPIMLRCMSLLLMWWTAPAPGTEVP